MGGGVLPGTENPAEADPLLVDGLVQLTFLIHGVVADVAAAYGLSVVQVRLLGVLRDRRPGMHELGRLLGLEKSSMTGLIARAERRGFVRRSLDPDDRRAFRIAPTDAGTRLTSVVAADLTERIAGLVSQLSAGDRHHLARLTNRVFDAAGERRPVEPVTAAARG